MKKLLALAFLLLTGASFAQLTPEFEFQLYFEDAAGNKDTITLGYDPLATDTIDTAFGEVNILNQPWGDSLDVRIGDLTYNDDFDVNYQLTWLTPNTYLTKKQILSSYCNKGLDKSGRVSLHCNLKNLPIRVKWMRQPFLENDCIFTSSLYAGYYFLEPANFDAPIPRIQLSVMGEESSINKYQNDNTDNYSFYLHNQFKIPTYLVNGDSIGIFQFVFWQKDTSTINTKKIEPQSNIQIYPNPTTDIVTIDNQGNNNLLELMVYNVNGVLINKQKLTSDINAISMKDYSKGVYFFKINNDKNLIITKKIIKI